MALSYLAASCIGIIWDFYMCVFDIISYSKSLIPDSSSCMYHVMKYFIYYRLLVLTVQKKMFKRYAINLCVDITPNI